MSRSIPVWSVRALIRIEECRLEFYQQMVDRANEESVGAAMNCARNLKERWSLCLQRLQFRRAQLAGIAERQRAEQAAQQISPAAPSLGHAVPSNDAGQPANPS